MVFFSRSSPVATWLVKDLNASPGWTVNGPDDSFAGPLVLTQAANMTLADFLGA